jgi:hypothetical protein
MTANTKTPDAKAWFTPSSTFAKIIQFQSGAKSRMKGTGMPNSHPTINTFYWDVSEDEFPKKAAFPTPAILPSFRLLENGVARAVILGGSTSGRCSDVTFFRLDAGSRLPRNLVLPN